MVFIFGLIHGFGLSTKLQEIAVEHHITLSLAQILSFNVGVELGQIGALLIVYPILLLMRGQAFEKLSKISNWGLIIAGIFLVFYQLNGYFTDHQHTHHELNEKHHIDVETHSHNHKDKKHKHTHDTHNHEQGE